MNAGDGPVIASAALGPGHDGQAEVVIELVYPNGGRSRLSVTHTAVSGALQSAGVHHLDELTGRPWTVLIGRQETTCST
jgi:hypothetical protein